MSQFVVKPSKVKGSLEVPPSKSQSLRAILFGALGEGKSRIYNALSSPDIAAMIEACRLLGASIELEPGRIDIKGISGKVKYAEDIIHAGNSGIVLRFCTAIGALASLPVVITGDYSIRHQRPMKPLIEALGQLEVSVKTMKGDGFAPVIIQGPIKSGKAIVNGEDSQPVSALLMASALAEGPVELEVLNPGEKPWVLLTLNWFDRLGIPYENHHFKQYKMKGNSKYEGFEYHVPGDFSSAAFPIAAALVTQSEVTLQNMDMGDFQGDKKVIEVFRQMGAQIEVDEKKGSLHVKKGSGLSSVKVDINDFVDAITILAVVACFAEGETLIYNASVAKQKECNRIHCIAVELQKMGADIVELEDGLRIQKSPLKGTKVISYHDHRMVMSLAVAGLGASGTTVIDSIECVSKTYPTFVQDFSSLGANIQVMP
jgi:3-phosphoshikimate 1-carboxyvinyltransferase